MVVAVTLFSAFVTPVIAMIAWGIALFRLRNWGLASLTALVALFIVVTSWDNPSRFTRNPYIMLTFTTLVILTISLIPHTTEHDRPYLIAADTVLLLMMVALHGWRVYLRQSTTYFTEQSVFAGVFAAFLLTSLTLSIPLIAIIERANPPKNWRWVLGLVLVSILLSSVVATPYIL